jgi:hypothetical protein
LTTVLLKTGNKKIKEKTIQLNSSYFSLKFKNTTMTS